MISNQVKERESSKPNSEKRVVDRGNPERVDGPDPMLAVDGLKERHEGNNGERRKKKDWDQEGKMSGPDDRDDDIEDGRGKEGKGDERAGRRDPGSNTTTGYKHWPARGRPRGPRSGTPLFCCSESTGRLPIRDRLARRGSDGLESWGCGRFHPARAAG